MATEAQTCANRRNAQKSTAPRTNRLVLVTINLPDICQDYISYGLEGNATDVQNGHHFCKFF